MKTILLVCCLAAAGCASQAKLVRALARDPATVKLKSDLETVYGRHHLEFERSFPCPCPTNSP